MKEALTFDDVLLVPQKSKYSPSKVSTEIKLTPKIKLGIPILSAAMDTVTESQMAITLAEQGGLGIINKNMTESQQAAEVKKVKAKKLLCGASISVGDPAIKRADFLAKAGVDILVIDVAHGHYYKVIETIKNHGGSIAQKELPGLTGFSKAKISILLNELKEEGLIRKTFRGRENQITLKKGK